MMPAFWNDWDDTPSDVAPAPYRSMTYVDCPECRRRTVPGNCWFCHNAGVVRTSDIEEAIELGYEPPKGGHDDSK